MMTQSMAEYQEENERFGRQPTREELGALLRSGMFASRSEDSTAEGPDDDGVS